MDRREWRGDDDVHVLDVLDVAAELLGEDDRLLHGLEHLPVAGDERGAHRRFYMAESRRSEPRFDAISFGPDGSTTHEAEQPAAFYLSVSAATPGSTCRRGTRARRRRRSRCA